MKTILLSILLLITVGTIDAYAQVNGTDTNSTSIETIKEPQITLSSTEYQQGDLLEISGTGIEENRVVETTIYHPDNSKFGIFKTTSTTDGEFRLLVEIAHTSIHGNYTVMTEIGSTTITNTFGFAGEHKLSFVDSNYVTEEISPLSNETTSQTNTPSNTQSGSTSHNTQTQSSDLKTLLQLLHAIIEANNSILIQIESMLESMG